MLRVLVEIHPHGIAERKRTIATIDIANVSGLAEISDYLVTASLDGEPICRSTITAHRRSDGWIPLVHRVLTDLIERAAKKNAPPGIQRGGVSREHLLAATEPGRSREVRR